MDAPDPTEPVQLKRWQLWAMRLSIISAIAHVPTVIGLILGLLS